ncbi:MAG: hypothetical protein AB7V59_05380 [Gammaproteobacteria bacterium]
MVALMIAAGAAAAAPEMRCRLNGAYIKVYGKNDAEMREVCERQGGEFTRYTPSAGSNGPQNLRRQAMDSIFGQRPRVGIR